MQNVSKNSSALADIDKPDAKSDALDAHVDEMLLVLINVLEVGAPHVTGYTRPFWIAHLLLLKNDLEHHKALPRAANDFKRLCGTLLRLAYELRCIRRLVNSNLIPRTPELAKAIRKASQKLDQLAATVSVQQLEQSQEHLFAWGSSLVKVVNLFGEVFNPNTLYALKMWPADLDSLAIGVVKRGNFPTLEVGACRKTATSLLCAGRLLPSGGVKKFEPSTEARAADSATVD